MARATREQWEKRVRRWQQSRWDTTSFAAQEGVSLQQLRWWRWHLGLGPRTRRAAAPPPVVEVVLAQRAAQAMSTQAGSDIELVVGHRRVLVRPGFDEQSLRRVLAVLEES